MTDHNEGDKEKRGTDSAEDDEHVHSVCGLFSLLGFLFLCSERHCRCSRGLSSNSGRRVLLSLSQCPRRLGREDGLDEALNLATCNTDVHESRVGRLALGMDLAGVFTEDLADKLQVLGTLPHERASVSLGDLDVALEHGVVLVAEFESSDGHALRDGDEVEDGLLFDTSHVEEAVLGTLEREENHLTLTLKSLLLVLGQEDLRKRVDVLAPDLARPEVALIVMVLPDVADNVGLLQELTHALHQLGPLEQDGVRQASLDEQPCETLSNETCNVVAVQLVVFDGVHTLLKMLRVLCVVGHAIAHPLGNVLDDDLVLLLDGGKFPTDNIKLDQQLAILLIGTVLREGPCGVVEDLIESSQQRLLLRYRNGHVILDCVESSEDQVEQADRKQEFGVELLNDSGERARCEGEETEALLHVLGLLRLIALMDSLVPDFPLDNGAQLAGVCEVVCDRGDGRHVGGYVRGEEKARSKDRPGVEVKRADRLSCESQMLSLYACED